ncbi:hypothetical protein K431DRAFT_216903 [Polychaeton citri CBS 116435]|uniref:RING-type domain-containing protein n=1 Tax=Polychaeton citri CBS 116435 TaxID=1314669 RepID=A0A9P4QH65_9PEZI|nr:hypothetical protein K431DRAFT_216903 [Polychaeton citri CBS 116435]
MSNLPLVTSKAAVSSAKSSSSAAQVSPAASATQQFFSNDGGSRRSGSTGATSSKNSAPRNIQISKPKHKNGKRFKSLDEDADAEMYSMQNPHGRRGQQSITHLMQFSLPPRPNHDHRRPGHGGGRGFRRNPTWGLGSGYHAVDKARYIHANYRFIVDPRGDYRAQSEDAEVHLDWNSVLQIIASSKTQSASCPICLGEPTAPRMAKCGHMFCLPCLIRYMHSEDEDTSGPEKKARWKKCPICEDSIYISETRPVRMYAGQEWDRPSEGADVVLRLVRRKPGETLAMPRESADPIAKGEHIPWYFAAEVMDYARIMKGSEDYILSQYNEAIDTIEKLEKEDELMFGEDTQWTRRAVRMLNEHKEKVKGIGNPPLQPKKPEQEVRSARPPIQYNEDESNIPQMYLQKQSETPQAPIMTENAAPVDATAAEAQNQPTSGSYIPRTIHEMRQRQLEKPQPNEYLFYHALQHYYLSSLDIRILKSAFGSYNNFPSSILPRVERVSSGHIVDDELKKRVKYLSHLPYGCEVGFLECDWTDTVNPEVLREFQPMTERRRRRNEEKEAREEKDRVRIEKQAEREYAAVRRKRPSIPDDLFSSEGLPGLGVDPSVVDVENQTLEDGAFGATPPWQNRRSTSGFASLASPSTSPTANRTVWGTTAVAPSSPDFNAALPKDSELHDDGWLQGWEKDILEEQTLAAQAESMTLEAGEKQPASRGKKGKKGKKITLMSTTARRHA